MIPRIRRPAVAGTFYPSSAVALGQMVDQFLEAAKEKGPFSASPAMPKAIIVPHAGYVYSGSVAAAAYRFLEPFREKIKKVVLLGPSHRVSFRGMALPSCTAFRTPFGEVPVHETEGNWMSEAGVEHFDAAHAQEHGLEVQLPFLQKILDGFEIIPVVIGEAEDTSVASVIECLSSDNGSLVLVSSDLSHYLCYEEANAVDRDTTDRILNLTWEGIGPEQACGSIPLRGLLRIARKMGWKSEVLDLRNSGDTAGPKDRVVGYGAYAFVE